MCNAKDCEQYHSDNTCCTCQNLEWYKLKQTLTEIKEIAEEYAHNCDFSWECEKCDYSCFSKQILQKISEVENDR